MGKDRHLLGLSEGPQRCTVSVEQGTDAFSLFLLIEEIQQGSRVLCFLQVQFKVSQRAIQEGAKMAELPAVLNPKVLTINVPM